MHTSFEVSPEEAIDPLVLALDVGSTASRGGAYDGAGRPITGIRHKVPHAFTTAADGTSTIDADAVVAELTQIIDRVVGALPGRRFAAVGIDTFSASLVGIDATGAAITPCFTYADSRCAAEVDALRRELDEAQVQERTGTRLHNSYLAPRLRWLAATGQDAGVARWISLGEYAHEQLLGASAAGVSVAAWTGLLDRRTGQWDPQMLAAAGITVERLNPVHPPPDVLGAIDDRIARRWPTLADAVWLPPIADGYAANLGAGVADPGSAVLSTATSGAIRVLIDHVPQQLPTGLWCYRVDASRSLLGGAVNDVGRAIDWLRATLDLPDEHAQAQALTAPPEPGTPLVLPFLSGERSTGWQARARAVVTGLSAGTAPLVLWRGGIEGIALTYARVAAQLREVTGLERVRVGGRVQQGLPELVPVLADALGLPATPVVIKRMTLHGTAIHALDVVAPGGRRAEPDLGTTRAPDPARHDYYRGRLVDFEDVYTRLFS